ncbi:hypothetical protein Hamer_G010736, partial [Homarus americanus]
MQMENKAPDAELYKYRLSFNPSDAHVSFDDPGHEDKLGLPDHYDSERGNELVDSLLITTEANDIKKRLRRDATSDGAGVQAASAVTSNVTVFTVAPSATLDGNNQTSASSKARSFSGSASHQSS